MYLQRGTDAEKSRYICSVRFALEWCFLKGATLRLRYKASFVLAEQMSVRRQTLRKQGWYRVFYVPYGKTRRKGFFIAKNKNYHKYRS